MEKKGTDKTMLNKYTIHELLPLLKVPGVEENLKLSADGKMLGSKSFEFPILKNKVILFPPEVMKFFDGKGLSIPFTPENILQYQYYLISTIKQNAPIRNLILNDQWYEQHLKCSTELLSGVTGNMLDIGCDSDARAQLMFPSTLKYIGLDVCHSADDDFQIVGMAEMLPFKDASFDNVALFTSLDHVFDYKTAVNEAARVLKPGGHLYLASLVWYDRVSLFPDNHHFHHFGEGQLLDCLGKFKVESSRKYDWKDGGFRQALYLKARKL